MKDSDWTTATGAEKRPPTNMLIIKCETEWQNDKKYIWEEIEFGPKKMRRLAWIQEWRFIILHNKAGKGRNRRAKKQKLKQ